MQPDPHAQLPAPHAICKNGTSRKATICDPKLRTANTNAQCGSALDFYYWSPWRSPGRAPVIDACGIAGGRIPGQGPGIEGADYHSTPHAPLGTRGSVWALTVHEGMLLGAVGDSSIKVWRMDTWEQTCTLSGHRGLVLALACYGDRLISGSDDRCIRVWRMGSWECERILTGHNGGVVGVCIVHGAQALRSAPRPLFCCSRLTSLVSGPNEPEPERPRAERHTAYIHETHTRRPQPAALSARERGPPPAAPPSWHVLRSDTEARGGNVEGCCSTAGMAPKRNAQRKGGAHGMRGV